MEKIPCSVEILTYNSGKTLEACLESVKDFSDIIILDGNSTDATLEIAKRYGARVFPQVETTKKNVRIEHFAEVRNKGLSLAKFKWFLFIDSDEYISKEAVEEIREIVSKGESNKYFVYNIPRMSVVKGKVLDKFRPSYQTRFFNLNAVDTFIKRVHERIKVKDGYEVGTLKHPEYVPLEDINILKQKWSGYIDMQMKDIKKVSFSLLFLKTRANLYKFIKYWIKYIITLALKPGNHMPFWYEYHNAMYHIKIIWRVWKKFLSK